MEVNRLKLSVKKLDWDCEDEDTRYLTHSIHRYSGKFIPQIASNVINMLTKPGEIILDPYCGSGTTLLEASVLGRKSIGVDLNPVACLISRVKVMKISASRLKGLENFWESCLDQFLDAESSNGNTKLEKAIIKKVENDFRLSHPWFTKWFNTRNLFHLLIIDNLINELEEN